MSQQEFDKNDQEVIDMANRSAPAEAEKQAEQLLKKLNGTVKRKKRFCTIMTVLVCIAITLGLMVALFVPSAVVWVVNIGVLFCGMASAVAVDRYFRGC